MVEKTIFIRILMLYTHKQLNTKTYLQIIYIFEMYKHIINKFEYFIFISYYFFMIVFAESKLIINLADK